MMFHILTLLEYPEPDWNGPSMNVENRITEIHFDVDHHIKNEVERVTSFVQETVSRLFITKSFSQLSLVYGTKEFPFLFQGNRIIVSTTCFSDYGKTFMKTHRLHPDAYIQMIIQVVYYKIHFE